MFYVGPITYTPDVASTKPDQDANSALMQQTKRRLVMHIRAELARMKVSLNENAIHQVIDRLFQRFQLSATQYFNGNEQFCLNKTKVCHQNHSIAQKINHSSIDFSPIQSKDGADSQSSYERTFHFPEQFQLGTCLKKHPLTKDPYFTEKKIIETVAKQFQNSVNSEFGVAIDASLALKDLNEKLQLPERTLHGIALNVVEALKDCAAEETIAPTELNR